MFSPLSVLSSVFSFPRLPVKYIITESAASGAVSALRILLPKVAAAPPLLIISSTSELSNPPSLPIKSDSSDLRVHLTEAGMETLAVILIAASIAIVIGMIWLAGDR